jgi:hypothetical protein
VGPRNSLEIVEKRNICPCRESNPGCPARSPARRHGHRSDVVYVSFVTSCVFSQELPDDNLSRPKHVVN